AGWAAHRIGIGSSDPVKRIGQNAKAAPDVPSKSKEDPAGKQDKNSPSPKDLHGDPLPEQAVGRLGQARGLHGDPTYFVRSLPDGKKVVTLSTDVLLNVYTIRFWEFPSGKEIGRRIDLAGNRPGDRIGVQGRAFIALAKDGKTIAISPSSSEILLYDLVKGKQ